MTVRSRKLLSAIAIEFSDGEMVELRRVPYLHDTFVDTEGRVVRLVMPDMEIHASGRVVFRYGTSTMMLARVMLDTYMPGWDNEGNMTSFHTDGDPTNNAISNLDIRPSNRPGRPPSNVHRRLFKALQLLDRTKDVYASAREYKLSPNALLEACKTTLPDLYDALTVLDPKAVQKRHKNDKLIVGFCLSEKQQQEAREHNRKLCQKAVKKRAKVPDDDDLG